MATESHLIAGETPMDARPDVTLPSKRTTKDGGRIILLTLDDMDGRTLAARRARQLIDALGADDPGVGVEQRLRIVDLAVLNAMTEDMATRYFQGEAVDRIEFATLTNAKRRILDSL
jgi:hypothetical protein